MIFIVSLLPNSGILRVGKKYNTSPYGICTLSCIPLRMRPDERSSVVSQMLFGECFEILKYKTKKWIKILCEWDGSIGWVDAFQVTRITEKQFDAYTGDRSVALELSQIAFSEQRGINLLLGSSLPLYDGISFRCAEEKFTYSGQALRPVDQVWKRDFVEKIARKYLHTPYCLRGRSPFGIDSAGYVQILAKILNVRLPRMVHDQIQVGEQIDFVEQARLGDIAFFENKEGEIHHTGFVLDDGMIIHAYGSVRIDKLDHQGIYHKPLKKYTHHLRVIKRIIEIEDKQEV